MAAFMNSGLWGRSCTACVNLLTIESGRSTSHNAINIYVMPPLHIRVSNSYADRRESSRQCSSRIQCRVKDVRSSKTKLCMAHSAADGRAMFCSYSQSGDNMGLVSGDGEGLALPLAQEPMEIKQENKGMQGMAEAFAIRPSTAFAITGVIACAAVVLPFFMQASLGAHAPSVRILKYATLLCGFYMAWNIGANDVANAMGTSVGSGALTLRQAVITAAVLEFSGAFLVGSHVSHTMQNGILVADVFAGKSKLLFCGMLSSLAAAGTWLQVASFYGYPVSTTHCIIGAMVGFGLVYGGVGAVYWKSLARVVASWLISPLFGATVSFLVYKCIRTYVYGARNPGQAAAAAAPVAVFIGVSPLAFTAFLGAGGSAGLGPALGKALACAALGAYVMREIVRRRLGSLLAEYQQQATASEVGPAKGPTGTQLRIVYAIFGYLQVLSACFMSFAHGANDVANAIGPISAALAILSGGSLATSVGISTDVLAWGGFGIVAGLLVWGYRVIATIGNKITELTPTRGFAAEFGAASVVVVASRLGLPISATHTLVGAVMGVGFARGMNSVRGDVVKEIVASWLITIPLGAALSIFYTFVLLRIVPSVF